MRHASVPVKAFSATIHPGVVYGGTSGAIVVVGAVVTSVEGVDGEVVVAPTVSTTSFASDAHAAITVEADNARNTRREMGNSGVMTSREDSSTSRGECVGDHTRSGP